MYFLPLISYRIALSIRNESLRKSIYLIILSLLMVLFLTLLNVADNLLGFVREPIADDKILRSSSNSALFRMLFLPVISEM